MMSRPTEPTRPELASTMLSAMEKTLGLNEFEANDTP